MVGFKVFPIGAGETLAGDFLWSGPGRLVPTLPGFFVASTFPSFRRSRFGGLPGKMFIGWTISESSTAGSVLLECPQPMPQTSEMVAVSVQPGMRVIPIPKRCIQFLNAFFWWGLGDVRIVVVLKALQHQRLARRYRRESHPSSSIKTEWEVVSMMMLLVPSTLGCHYFPIY